MKKLFLLIFAVLLVLGSALPLAAYRVTRAVLGHTAPLPAASSVPELPTSQPKDLPSADAETFPVEDQSAGKVVQLSRREYVLGAVAAEMPVSWPDEALKAQAVAAHTYALYCRDHAALQSGAWLTVDPARRQGCLTEPVLRSYWGTAYEQNYARLSALVDEVLNDLLFYDNAPACTSYFAISNGRTEASENVWGTALPYLIPVDSSTDLSADNYQYTAAGFFRPWHHSRSRRTGKLVRPGRTDLLRLHKNAHHLRTDRFRHSPASGTGSAQHLLYRAVPERKLQLYHPGLRPWRGPEPVGCKGHGRAGRGLCGYFSSLLPRNTAAQDGVVTENSIS